MLHKHGLLLLTIISNTMVVFACGIFPDGEDNVIDSLSTDYNEFEPFEYTDRLLKGEGENWVKLKPVVDYFARQLKVNDPNLVLEVSLGHFKGGLVAVFEHIDPEQFPYFVATQTITASEVLEPALQFSTDRYLGRFDFAEKKLALTADVDDGRQYEIHFVDVGSTLDVNDAVFNDASDCNCSSVRRFLGPFLLYDSDTFANLNSHYEYSHRVSVKHCHWQNESGAYYHGGCITGLTRHQANYIRDIAADYSPDLFHSTKTVCI